MVVAILETVVLVVMIYVDSGDDDIDGVYVDANGALIVKVVVVVMGMVVVVLMILVEIDSSELVQGIISWTTNYNRKEKSK